jgi:uncharacterized protein
MGNIPLVIVLNANGVLFAGIMGFIYSALILNGVFALSGIVPKSSKANSELTQF